MSLGAKILQFDPKRKPSNKVKFSLSEDEAEWLEEFLIAAQGRRNGLKALFDSHMKQSKLDFKSIAKRIWEARIGTDK